MPVRYKRYLEDKTRNMDHETLSRLKIAAKNIRLGAIEAVYSAASGHPGGSLSIADVLAYLYMKEMNIDPADPKKADRDRLVLSKGHTTPGLYAALAERGYFSKDKLKTFRQVDSILQGHPDMKGTPGVDMTTGSLGLGFSSACGMALGEKLAGRPSRVYAIIGDGELEEGQIWEAAMFARHYKLDNLVAVIDNNGLQIDGKITEVIDPTPIPEKFTAFGWNVITIDGHDFEAIGNAFTAARACKNQPTAIICHTSKGKGVSFMENNVKWHGSAPNKEQYEQAISELTATR